MHAIILVLTLFMAPTPEHPTVEVRTESHVLPSADACVAVAHIINAQAAQDPKILLGKAECFDVSGPEGTKA
jgi:hypothetical protein